MSTSRGGPNDESMSPAMVRRDFRPGALIESLLRAGLSAPAASIRQRSVGAPEGIDWAHFCAVAYRCRIAPVLYQCFRRAALTVPPDVLNWFRVQHYETVARNMVLLHELRQTLGWLSEASIPAIVLKGPALAELGLGAVRVSSDLDILVHDGDLRRVDVIMRRHGHKAWTGPPHDFHVRYSRPTASGTSVVEIHFDIFDRPRAIRPDVGAIWDRSYVAAVSDLPARVPELSDHVLLTIMQLPHHHWAMRLMVDLWLIALRWGDRVDWSELLERAGSWQMKSLARATLHALVWMFDVPLPESMMPALQPSGYFERVQWKAVRDSIAEHLNHPFRPRVMLLAPFLLVDRGNRVPGILLKQALGLGGSSEESSLVKAGRRNVATVAALPAIARVLLDSLSPVPVHTDGQDSARAGSP